MSGENVLKNRKENDCFKKRTCSLPIPCESIPNAKRVSLRIEDSVEKLNKGKRVSKEVWRVLKILLFATCSTFYLSQSMEFYKRFCEYPTTTSMEVINPEFYKMPAVTVCLRNLIKRSKFCAENPDNCEKPRKRKLFCKKHPYMCKKNVANLMIPILGYHTIQSGYLSCKTAEYIQEMLFHGIQNNSLPSGLPWQKWKTTYVYDYEAHLYSRCYSDNLHISSDEKAFEKKLDGNSHDPLRFSLKEQTPLSIVQIHHFVIKVDRKELLFPWLQNQAAIFLHSPFVPVNPFVLGKQLKPGHEYNIYLKMNEEKLLPHPFPTNCTDYEALWQKNNRTGPRSKEMCQELCVKMSMTKACEARQTMLMNPKEICNTMGCGNVRFFLNQDDEFLENCMANCRPSCLKRKYQYTVEDVIPDEISGQKRSTIPVNIFLSDRDITVISHNQLYGAWDLFSNIGGLMGCWLGISVWTLVGIAEATYSKLIVVLKKMWQKLDCRSLNVRWKCNHQIKKTSSITISGRSPTEC